MSEDCIFCKMASGEIQPDIVHETDNVLAFRDQNPQAPTHIVLIPRSHIATLNDLQAADQDLIGEIVLAATEVARKEGIAERGYRLVANCHADGGQTVFHIHFHLVGGRSMDWPPG
jgi:histidine triad (HIT) family protein